MTSSKNCTACLHFMYRSSAALHVPVDRMLATLHVPVDRLYFMEGGQRACSLSTGISVRLWLSTRNATDVHIFSRAWFGCHVGRSVLAGGCYVGMSVLAGGCHVGRSVLADGCHVDRSGIAGCCHEGRRQKYKLTPAWNEKMNNTTCKVKSIFC